MIEVELKAWIFDKQKIEAILRQKCKFIREYKKKDIYYKHPAGKKRKGFRVRNEGESVTVTFKDKNIKDGIEMNVENEFTVSDPDAFTLFTQRLGCREKIRKMKTGLLFTLNDLNIELIDVEGLGCFIEIEKLVKSDDIVGIKKAGSEIRNMLEYLGVDAEKIEDRFYTNMLKTKNRSKTDKYY